MPFNGPVNGDYTNVDVSKAPWAPGIMTLTHEECVFVLDEMTPIREGFERPMGGPDEPDDFYMVARYNETVNYEQGINGDTYNVLKGYDPEYHTLGIDENGVVREAPTEDEETPTEETPTEPEQPAEDEAPTGNDEQAGE